MGSRALARSGRIGLGESGKKERLFFLLMDPLDSYLLDALQFLRDSPDGNKGVVAAGIIDGERVVYATSVRAEDGKRWKHAERAVLKNIFQSSGKCRQRTRLQ